METNKNENYQTEKEYIPFTIANVKKYADFSDEARGSYECFAHFLAGFYFLMSRVDIDNRTLGILYRITEFPFSNGITEFFVSDIKDDEEEVIKAVGELEKNELIEVIKIKKNGSDTLIKLQLAGNLKRTYDGVFKDKQCKKLK